MKYSVAIMALVMATLAFEVAETAPVQRMIQDVKLPTQKVLEVYDLAAPAANDTTAALSNNDGPSSAAAKTITSFSAQPDFARNVTVIAGAGTASDLDACIVTVSGTNINGHAISETFTFSNDTLATKTGSKAFKTLTSVAWPASCESGAFSVKWWVGYGLKFGLKRCMTNAGDVFRELLDGASATAGTFAASASAVESNTDTFNTTPNASHSYRIYYVQNYQCF